MKYTLYFIILLFLGGCHDDNEFFDVMMKKENIRFEPIPGGAVMFYTLPVGEDVFGIQLRYRDARGEEVLKVGSYVGDSLVIDGFNESEKNVPARVSLVDRNNNESKAIDVVFDTEESAACSFFNGAEVLPYWNGFQVKYGASRQTSGMVHVMYLGINPITQKSDTILLKSFPITLSGDTLEFVLQQKLDKATVVLRTEDYRGYRVKQKIWKDVDIYSVEELQLTEMNFIDKDGCSVENEKEKIGVKYLFDGDTKGEQRLKAGKIPELYSFLGGPMIQNKSLIFDLEQERMPAFIRIYGALKSLDWPLFSTQYTSSVYEIFRGVYDDKLPCNVILYGSNDKDGDNWVELGSFSQDSETLPKNRWSERCTSQKNQNFVGYLTEEELGDATPAYLEIQLPCDDNMVKYRYIKLEIKELFKYVYFSGSTPVITVINTENYVAIQELEIYVKRD